MEKKFAAECMNENNPKWDQAVQRHQSLYQRKDELRSAFFRDYTRILHCTAYRRLKHKTQVFFATNNDHICTRIEHVGHVASVSYAIANELGLNTELTNAISIGHDLGHAPFGHAGEDCIKEISSRELGNIFWHEKNSLRFVDNIETLRDVEGNEQNLSLTYAVRDGIICHCGEVNEISIKPRGEPIELEHLTKVNEVLPYTWEGCVVKIADKISYLGRDIEDALTLNILTGNEIVKLKRILKHSRIMLEKIPRIKELTNTFLMHNFVINLCKTSFPDKGIQFSEPFLDLINAVKDFNYRYIYKHERLNMYKEYAHQIIAAIYKALLELYKGEGTVEAIRKLRKRGLHPCLLQYYEEWLLKYMKRRSALYGRETHKYENTELYDLTNMSDYKLSIIEFISGMTDGFAIKVFNELTSF